MRRAIIVLLVLVGLLVAADFGAAALAESAVSRQMRQQIGLVDDPNVRINGFSFLAQAIAGRYSSVDVEAQRISVEQLQDLEVTAQLRDVDAPLSTLLGSGPKSLKVGEAEGSVRILAKELERLVNRNGALTFEDLRIDPIDSAGLRSAAKDGGDSSLTSIDPEHAARLTGTTTLPLLGSVEVSVISQLLLSDGKAQLVPRDIRVGDTTLPSTIQRTIKQMFTLSIDPGALPLKVTPTKLTAVDGTLQISGIAQNLTLGGAQQTSTG